MTAGVRPRAVFINCPFDDAYRPLFEAIVFTIYSCGFEPRCAMEIVDSTGTRIAKIMDMIGECPLGIHDLSRTELDPGSNLPRFNMPFELGLFLGAWRFGDDIQKAKKCLILDRDRYRFQSFISDIGGQDISDHRNEVKRLIGQLRDFLRTHATDVLPDGKYLHQALQVFEGMKDGLCRAVSLDSSNCGFVDFCHLVTTFLTQAGPTLVGDERPEGRR